MKLLAFSLFAVMIFLPVFGQSMITFDVDTTKLVPGEIVELKGSVQQGLEGQPVAVEIKDSNGNAILIRTVTPDSDGNFVLKFKVPSTVDPGDFDIVTNVEVEGQAFSESKPIEAVGAKLEPSEPICGEGTILKDGLCVVDQTVNQETKSETQSRGGGCLIATATYGSEMAPQVQQLRELRDNKLLQTESGKNFMDSFNDFYYSFSPTIADYERENSIFKETVKIVITPMISSLSILNYVDIDSEAEVLGYGIFLIILNLGMYVGIPASVIIGIKKRF